MDENQQSSVQQEFIRLFPSTREGGEVKAERFIELVQVNQMLLQQLIQQIPQNEQPQNGPQSKQLITKRTPSTTKQTIIEIWESKTCGDSQ